MSLSFYFHYCNTLGHNFTVKILVGDVIEKLQRCLHLDSDPRMKRLGMSYLFTIVGVGRFELPTTSMSTMRSNQMSYKPVSLRIRKIATISDETQTTYESSFTQTK